MARLTQTVVNRMPYSKQGQRYVWDDRLGLRIGASSIAYVIQTQRHGRITLGRHPDILLKHARKLAEPYLEEPKTPGRKSKLDLTMTLKQAIAHTVEVRKPKIDEYTQVLHLHLADWLDEPVRNLTEDDVEGKFDDLLLSGKKATARKFATLLGTVLRTVRRRCGLGNTVATQFLTDEGRLPTLRKKKCAWETDEQFAAVVAAVREYPNTHLVNMAMLQCFTGMRLDEARRLRWDAMDSERMHMVVRETKTGSVLILPLCDVHRDVLSAQQALVSAMKLEPQDFRTGYVFPALRRATKQPYIQEVKDLYYAAEKTTGIPARSHDWRRWFISVGSTLADVSPDMRRRLTNHVSGEDAHQGYILGAAEQLRPAMEAVTSKLLTLAEPTSSQ